MRLVDVATNGASLRGFKGGSGGSQRQPVEAPDSLISIEQVRILDLIGEGDIVGLVDGINSIYLDEAPGSSYPSLQWDYRLGTQDQSYMPGFPAVESEINIGVNLLASSPFVRAVTNITVSALRINFQLGRFAQQDPSNGDTNGCRVEFAIDLAQGLGEFQEIRRSAFDGKTTTGYSRGIRVDLTYPAPAGGWRIRVRRITPDSTSSNVSDVVSIRSVTEIIDYKFRYPNSAIVGVNFDAEAFGGKIPKRSYHIKGRIVSVPANYDPVARTYSGIWDGSFKPAWTNNPVWVYYDLLLHPRYGLGDRINANQIDKWGLYEISQYCDQMVDDGKGGQEPRFTCNMFLQKQADALRVMQDLASIFRGITYWGLGRAIVSADMPRDPVYTYTNANVRGGRFDRKGSKKSTVYSVILSAWSDPADFYRVKYEYVQDDALVAKYGVRSTTLANIGCTSQGQAHRAGKWALLSNKYETNTVTFSVGLEGIKAMPGQVIRVVDQHRQGRRVGGRVRDGSTTSRILVDMLPNINVAVGDSLVLNMPDGTSAVRTVSTLDHAQNAVTVASPFPALPVRGAVWAYEAEDLKSELYRVISVSDGSNPLEYTITALTYTEGKHEAIDFGTIISSRPTVSIPVAVVPAPQNVRISTDYKLDQYQAVTSMNIAWDKVVGAVRYDVEWRRDNSDWIYAGRVAATEVDVVGVYAGVYSARVRAINAVGILSQWSEVGPMELQGKIDPPPVPVNVKTTSEIFAIRLEWGFPAGAEDTAFTQIQMADNFNGNNPVDMGQFAYPTSMYLHTGMAAAVYRWFRLRLIDKTGNVGNWTPWVVGQSSMSADQILDYIQGQITESELGQELLGRIDLIDGTGPGSVKDQLNVLKENLENQIDATNEQLAAVDQFVQNQLGLVDQQLDDLGTAVTDVNSRVTAINNNLQDQIDAIADLADSMPYSPTKTYANGQAVLGADGKLYQARQNVPVNTPPPNGTYWDDIGQMVRDNNALASRVQTVETSITTINQTLSAQASQITGLQASLTTTNQNVTTAQQAAQAAADAAGAKGKVLYQSTAPATADRLPQNLWIDTTGNANTPKRWNGTAWVAVTDKVATDAAAAAAAANALAQTKADASTVTALTNRVTAAEGTITAQGTALTGVQATLSNIAGNGSNLVPGEYAVFGPTPPPLVTGGGQSASTEQDPHGFNGYVLRLLQTSGTGTTYFAPSNIYSGANIASKNKKYIFAWDAKSTSGAKTMQVSLRTITSDGTVRFSPGQNVAITDQWGRYSVVFDLTDPAFTADRMVVCVSASTNPKDGIAVLVDRLMLEEQVGNGVIPSTFAIGNNNSQLTALASTVSQLDARVVQTESGLVSQGSAITGLTNSLTTTNQNVTAAQQAAQAASDAAGAKGKVLYQSTAPATADRLPQNLWIDTTGNANTPKRWNGTAWVAVTDKVATDAAAAAAAANALALTKADASTVTALTNTVTQQGDTITAQGTALTNIQAAVSNIYGDNLLLDPTFSNSNGLNAQPSIPVLARNAVGVPVGAPSARVIQWAVATSTGNTYIGFTSALNVRPPENSNATQIAVREGEIYDVELTLYSDKVRQFGLWGQYYDAAGASVTHNWATQSGDGVNISSTANQWVKLTGSFVVPAGAVRMAMTARMSAGDALTAYIAAPSVRKRAAQLNALATATQSLDARVTQTEAGLTSQSTSITSLQNSLTTTNQNVTAAQQAAQAASDAAGAKGKVLFQSTTPATADRLAQNLWIDTTGNANTPKRWNGTAWVAVTDKVATDAAAAAAAASALAATKADASAVSSLQTTVNQHGDTLTTQGNSITSLNNSLTTTNQNVTAAQQAAQAASDAAGAKGKVLFQSSAPATADRLAQNLWIDTTGNANTPKRWNGSAWVAVTDKVATDAAAAAAAANALAQTKADASALSSLQTTVSQQGATLTSQGASITQISTSIGNIGSPNVILNPNYDPAGTRRLIDSSTQKVDYVGYADAPLGAPSPTVLRYEKVGEFGGWGGFSADLRNGTIYEPCSPGETINLEVQMLCENGIGTTGGRIAITFWEGTSGSTSPTGNARVLNYVNATGGWQKLTAQYVAPATAARFSIYYVPNDGVPPVGFKMYVANLSVTRQSAGEIALSQNKADVSTVTALTNTVTQQGNTLTAHGNSLTSIQASLSAIGGAGVNLVPGEYSSFNSNVLPSYTYGGNGITALVADPMGIGGYVLKTTSSTTTSSATIYTVNGTDSYENYRMPFKRGKYIISFYAKSETDDHQVAVFLRTRDSSNSALNPTTVLLTLTTEWARYSVAVDHDTSAYDNKDRMALGIQINRSGVVGRVVYWDKFMIEQQVGSNTQPSVFVGGSSVQQVAAVGSAVTAIDTRLTATENTVSSQSTSITNLSNSLTTTNSNVAAAQAAAQAASDAAGAKGKVLFQSTTPATADRLTQNLWIDTTGNANTPKRWNGSAWVAVTDKVATDAAAAAAAASALASTKADASTVTALSNTVTQQGNTLTAQGTSITNIQTSLGTFASDNLITDPTYAAGNNTNQSSATVLVRTDAAVPAGAPTNRVLSWNVPTSTGNTYMGINSMPNVRPPENALAHQIAVREGEIYDFELYVYSSISRQYGLWIQFYDAAGASVGHTWANAGGDGVRIATTANTWTKLTGTSTVPAGCIRMAMTLRFSVGDATSAFLSSPSCRKRSAMISANASAIQTIDARVTTAEGTLVAQSNSITQLNNSLAGKADNSALQALQNTVTQQGDTITAQGTAVTALQSTVGAIGGSGSNLNPSEYSVFGPNKPTIGAISTGLTYDVVADSAALGGYALKFATGSTSTTIACYLHSSNVVGAVGSFPISYDNSKYILSFYAKASVAGHQIRAFARYVTSSGSVGSVPSALFTLTTGWVRYSLVIDMTNATTYSGNQMAVAFQPNISGVSGRDILIDRVMVEKQIGTNTAPSTFEAGTSYTQAQAQASAISSLQTTVTQQGNTLTAQAQSISGLQTSIGNTNAQVSAMNTALTDLNGQASATNTIRVGIAADGTRYTAGYGVGINNYNGVVQSLFAVLADQFAIMHDVNGAVTTPFAVVNGQTFIKDALISKAAITNGIVGSTLTSAAQTNWVGPIVGFDFNAGRLAFHHPTLSYTYSEHDATGQRVYVNGVLRVRMGTW